MRLFIAEKPSVGKAIAARLGGGGNKGGYIEAGGDVVTWAFGHLFEQAPPDAYKPEWKNWAFSTLPMVPEAWLLLQKPDAAAQIKIIKGLLKKATSVVHAGDPDDEGELLICEILENAGWTGKTSRLWLSAMDDASVDKALKNLADASKTYPMKLAAEARSRADWLIGMNLSRAATLKSREAGGQSVLSVGRVQTPTLALVVNRDREIENFKPRDYFEVMGDFKFGPAGLVARWQPTPGAPYLDEESRVLDKKVAEGVAAVVKGAASVVTAFDTKEGKQAAPNPFALADIQSAASAKFSFTAQHTLDICQALYETHKVATYPRTDCGYLPESLHTEATRVLSGLTAGFPSLKGVVTGANVSLKHPAFNDKKVTAHHGIIPTGAGSPNGLSPDEQKVFGLIARRYIALFYPEFRYLQTTIAIEVAKHVFGTTGRVVKDPGWKVVLTDAAKDEEPPLPLLKKGDTGVCANSGVVAKQTKPPSRYTEGTLLKAMENIAGYVTNPEIKKLLNGAGGLGTPATRASMLETLKKRAFLEVQNAKFLVSTEVGRQFIAGLPTELTKPDLTAAYEKRLADIRSGSGNPAEFISKQAAVVAALVVRIQQGAATFGGSSTPAHPCPACGKALRKIKGPKGNFWGCTGYPTCKHTAEDARGKPAKPAAVKACPDCGKPMRSIKGAKGNFWGCTGYPTCKKTMQDDTPVKVPKPKSAKKVKVAA